MVKAVHLAHGHGFNPALCHVHAAHITGRMVGAIWRKRVGETPAPFSEFRAVCVCVWTCGRHFGSSGLSLEIGSALPNSVFFLKTPSTAIRGIVWCGCLALEPRRHLVVVCQVCTYVSGFRANPKTTATVIFA